MSREDITARIDIVFGVRCMCSRTCNDNCDEDCDGMHGCVGYRNCPFNFLAIIIIHFSQECEIDAPNELEINGQFFDLQDTNMNARLRYTLRGYIPTDKDFIKTSITVSNIGSDFSELVSYIVAEMNPVYADTKPAREIPCAQ